MDTSGITNESFWDYSVQIYSLSGVADVLLSLQDRYGVDVNMVLFCCWVGLTRGTFSDELFNTACDFSSSWCEHAVKPLRNIRTWMKDTGCQSSAINRDSCMSFREEVKGLELGAEKLQQETLESIGSIKSELDLPVTEQQNAVASNLKRYLDAAGISPDETLIHGLEVVMATNFPGHGVPPDLFRNQ